MTTATDRLIKLDKQDGASLMQELGTTGLERYNGLIHEEFLTKLRGELGRRAFREMENNDPIIGAMLFAIEMLLRPVSWTVEPFDASPEAETDAEFVESVFGDMAHDWAGFIGEWMAAPVYGFAPFEIVWKRRAGYSRNEDLTSKHSDGLLGVAKLAIRHPSTLDRWVYEPGTDRILAMTQYAAPDFQRRTIPAEKLLLFAVLQRKGNPEGTSLLRRAFIPYYRKKHIESVEAIGIERELAGLPMFHAPSEWFLSDASAEAKAQLAYIKKVARRIKTDEQGGLVIPAMYDGEGNKLLTFELVSAGGQRAIDTGPAKEYYSRHMAMSILADVILIGHEKVGSFALSSSKTNLFATGLGALLDNIEEVVNRALIPRLLDLNGRDPAKAPIIRHGDVETPDLESIGEYVSKLAGAGFDLFPTEDGELERVLLRAANLPENIAEHASDRFRERQEMQDAAREALANGTEPVDEEEEDDE